MTGRQEYDRNMTGRQDDRQDDRQRILDEYMIDLLPSVRALEVAAHNFIEPTVTEHERLELEAARSQQVNGLLVLVRKPELTRIE
jgi:hypothetical protein